MLISARTKAASLDGSFDAARQKFRDVANFLDVPAEGDETCAARTVIMFANTSWYLWNFRLALAQWLRRDGFQIVFVAPPDAFSNRLSSAGLFIPIEISRGGLHPAREFGTLLRFTRLMSQLNAYAVLSWTPKCNIYGALACRWLGVPIIPNVSGLGSGFVGRPGLARIVPQLYRHAFKTCTRVFFQNSRDMEHLIDWGCVGHERARLLPGSGVNLVRFRPDRVNENEQAGEFVFLFIGRLLREKGLCELAAAMRRLRKDGLNARLLVAGFIDAANPSALAKVQLRAWEEEGLIELVGSTDAPEALIHRADCVVHPSFYGEGLARVLLEAAACGRPVITTEIAGCKEAVISDVSGFLCKPRDSDSLYAAMKRMLLLPASARQRMGEAAREHMERGFSEDIVILSYVEALHAVAPR